MIILDFETTGLINKNPLAPLTQQPRVIEVGLMKVDAKGVELDRFTSLVNPKVSLEPKITEITGLTDGDLVYAPPFSAVLQPMQRFCLGEETLIIHNAEYDREILHLELRRLDAATRFPWPYNHICTKERCAHLMPGGKWPKQEELYQLLFGRPQPAGAHRAMNDVERLAEIVRELIARRII